jgi:hypothetical protein
MRKRRISIYEIPFLPAFREALGLPLLSATTLKARARRLARVHLEHRVAVALDRNGDAPDEGEEDPKD